MDVYDAMRNISKAGMSDEANAVEALYDRAEAAEAERDRLRGKNWRLRGYLQTIADCDWKYVPCNRPGPNPKVRGQHGTLAAKALSETADALDEELSGQ